MNLETWKPPFALDTTLLGVSVSTDIGTQGDVTPALAWAADGGLCLSDMGYRSKALQDSLIEDADLLLITPAESGDKRALISSLRERVETTFSQLWNRFVDRVFSRSWNGLWNTIKLKTLHFNLCLKGIIET